MSETKTIVVGVDGSDSSVHALRWALGEARLRGAGVEVVHSWHIPYYSDMSGMVSVPGDAMRESAEAVLAEVLAAVADDVGEVAITGRIELGAAATIPSCWSSVDAAMAASSRLSSVRWPSRSQRTRSALSSSSTPSS